MKTVSSPTPPPQAAIQAALAEARNLLEARRPAEAMMAVETVLARCPGEPSAESLRSDVLAAIATQDPALARLELTAVLRADDAAAQLELAFAYVGLDRPADAERCFKRALELSPQSADAHAGLGALYLSVDIRDGAEHYARRALALDGVHAVAAQTLATILEDRGEAAAAEAQLETLYRQRALFEEPAIEPRMRVLVLATVSAGNVPQRLIMPSRSHTRLVWYMEYARAEERPSPDRYDLVFNAIGDADLADASYPNVRRFLPEAGKPVLNDPDRVAATRRDRLPDLLGDIPNVVVPRTVRIQTPTPTDALSAAEQHGLAAPFLLRPLGSHGGQGLRRIEPGDAVTLPAGSDHYLTPYVDYRASDGLFRKYRIIFVGGQPLPYHLAIGEHWMIHHATSGMTTFDERRAEELRFLEDPHAALGPNIAAALGLIGERLGLDYCGIDFSVLPDGRLLVFEANATMLVHTEDPDGPYAAKNPYVLRIAAAFQDLLQQKASAPRPS